MTGRELKGIRRRLGYTQEEMADALGISQSYYAVLERGRRRVSDDLGIRALSIQSEPTEGKWFDQGYAVGRNMAGVVPRGYERQARPTAIRLAAEQAFQQWLRRMHGGAAAAEAWEAFQRGFEAGWQETPGMGQRLEL